MTEQEIIDLAERADVSIRTHYDESGSTPQELLRFAKLVAEKERDACAKVCDNERAEWNSMRDGWYAANYCAIAIRARSVEENNHG